jgi:hypothetical protein
MGRVHYSLQSKYAAVIEEQKARLNIPSDSATIQRALDLLQDYTPTRETVVTPKRTSEVTPQGTPARSSEIIPAPVSPTEESPKESEEEVLVSYVQTDR